MDQNSGSTTTQTEKEIVSHLVFHSAQPGVVICVDGNPVLDTYRGEGVPLAEHLDEAVVFLGKLIASAKKLKSQLEIDFMTEFNKEKKQGGIPT